VVNFQFEIIIFLLIYIVCLILYQFSIVGVQIQFSSFVGLHWSWLLDEHSIPWSWKHWVRSSVRSCGKVQG